MSPVEESGSGVGTALRCLMRPAVIPRSMATYSATLQAQGESKIPSRRNKESAIPGGKVSEEMSA